MSTASPKKHLSDLGKSIKRTVNRAINTLRVASAVIEGETVTIGSMVFEAKVNAAHALGAGNTLIDLSGSASAAATGTLTSNNTQVTAADTVTIDTKVYTFVGVAATGTITSNNTAPSDGDTVTIGGKTYTFKTTLTPTEGEVLINTTADAALLNLIRAINHTGTPNTDYKCAAANTQVSAASSVTSHAFAVTALSPGTAGNSIATTKVATTLSWGAATLTGGTGPAVEGDVLIGANADGSLLNLINAINHTGTPNTDYKCALAHPTVSAATSVTSHTFAVTALLKGTPGNSIASTKSAATLSWGAATLAGGTDPTAGEFTTAFTTALNGVPVTGITATRISANEILLNSLTDTVPDVAGNAAATGVLTSTANYADGETVTIGSTVYTFKTALPTNIANQVLIGANEAASITNLAAAINNTGTAGITFSNPNKPDPKVTAVAATHTLTVTAIRTGTAQNSVATTETAANASWGGVTLSGGTDLSYFQESLTGANNAWASGNWYGNVAAPNIVPSMEVASRVPNAQEIATKSIHFIFGFTIRAAQFSLRDSTGAVKAWDGTFTFSGNRATLASSSSVNMATNDLVTVTASE